jgi:hypothetical protein
MPREVWKELGVPLRLDHSLNMESVNMTCDSTLGVIENVPLDFGAGPMYFQVQVTTCANFDVLLGRPFFKLTSCRTFNLPNGEQDILLTDPNACKELCIPTLPWVKRVPPKELKHANSTEGSTILLASRTMLGECCLAAIQPKGFWTKLRAQERERECVCV